ncbi:sodium-dependent transporter [Photobacterium aphoticum]|uniref:Transporter n=1 Tax=Photobacterium aphoticum TaxID=754436 RepID=A0A090QW94_9GAMM|nr:sodium-dependent transporter [Photobacterium aphoticum]
MNREQWGSRAGFILAAVGSAIGLGNIWRFPYMAYENGGGAFFIPYLFAMITAGIPFMIMEFSLGHKLRGAAPRAFSKLGTKFEWLGWFQVSIAAIIAVYYVAIIGWAISYLGMAFTQSWGSDTNAFFFSEYLKLGENSPSQLGSLQFHIAIPMTIAWAITFAAIFTGVKGGIERASKIMMPLLFLMVLGFISRVVFLPGAMDGLNYLFQPDFSKILDAKVWSAAYGQIFFTLSVGFAIMIAYSSYLPKNQTSITTPS